MHIPYQVIRMADENYAAMPYVSQIDYSYLAQELCRKGVRRVLAVFGYTCLSFSEKGMHFPFFLCTVSCPFPSNNK